MLDRTAALDVPLDRRDQERGELRPAVDAYPRDLVAHADVREPFDYRGRILLPRMPGDLVNGRDRLAVEEALEEHPDGRHCHRLVYVRQAGEGREVRDAGVTRVEHAQLVLLPIVEVIGEQRAGNLPWRPIGREVVLHDPLPERLGDDGPTVDDARAFAQPV